MNTERQIYKLGNTFASITGVATIKVKDTGKVVDDLRKISDKVSLQAINANIVYGIEHIVEVLKITLESEKRKIMVANTPEIDLLLRLTYTHQISLALKYGGLKNNTSGCFIIFSKDKRHLLQVKDYIETSFEANNAVLKPNKAKRKIICYNVGLTSNKIFDDETFTRYLLERASLIVR